MHAHRFLLRVCVHYAEWVNLSLSLSIQCVHFAYSTHYSMNVRQRTNFMRFYIFLLQVNCSEWYEIHSGCVYFVPQNSCHTFTACCDKIYLTYFTHSFSKVFAFHKAIWDIQNSIHKDFLFCKVFEFFQVLRFTFNFS